MECIAPLSCAELESLETNGLCENEFLLAFERCMPSSSQGETTAPGTAPNSNS